jgi:hypothetical protein
MLVVEEPQEESVVVSMRLHPRRSGAAHETASSNGGGEIRTIQVLSGRGFPISKNRLKLADIYLCSIRWVFDGDTIPLCGGGRRQVQFNQSSVQTILDIRAL